MQSVEKSIFIKESLMVDTTCIWSSLYLNIASCMMPTTIKMELRQPNYWLTPLKMMAWIKSRQFINTFPGVIGPQAVYMAHEGKSIQIMGITNKILKGLLEYWWLPHTQQHNGFPWQRVTSIVHRLITTNTSHLSVIESFTKVRTTRACVHL